MDKKQQTVDTYNTSANKMARKFNDIGAMMEAIDEAFGYMDGKKDPFVVEVGCGNGRDAHEILRRTSGYVGIDISRSMIQLAKDANPGHEDAFILADLEEYFFPQGVDIIFSFASLLHTPKETMRRVLDKMYHTLNPGGIVYICLKYTESYQEITKTDEFGTRTYYHYSLDDMLESGGNMFHWHKCIYTEKRGQKWFTLILGK